MESTFRCHLIPGAYRVGGFEAGGDWSIRFDPAPALKSNLGLVRQGNIRVRAAMAGTPYSRGSHLEKRTKREYKCGVEGLPCRTREASLAHVLLRWSKK
jgi:hypothetical protein